MFAVWFLYLHCASLLFGARAVDGPYRPTHKSITWQRGTPDVVFQDTCHVSESHCGLACVAGLTSARLTLLIHKKK